MRISILHVARLIAVALTAALMTACTSTESKKSEVIRETDVLFKAYLEADVPHARQTLEQMIQLFRSQRAQALGASYQAHSLFCAYARLYVLEKRTGNLDNAEAALVRARYWQLESYVSSEDGWKNRVSLRELLSHNKSDNIVEIVEKLDKPANGGKGPKYAQQ